MLTFFMLLPGLYFVVADADRLEVLTEPAVAVLGVQQDGRNLVHLPDIGFQLAISTYCASGGQPESLSITVADTQRTLRAEELRGAGTVSISLRVPARQIAPLALQDFCVDAASEGDSILITAALAAQASLRCSHGDNQSMVFAAAPLDIRVDCVSPTDSAKEPAED